MVNAKTYKLQKIIIYLRCLWCLLSFFRFCTYYRYIEVKSIFFLYRQDILSKKKRRVLIVYGLYHIFFKSQSFHNSSMFLSKPYIAGQRSKVIYYKCYTTTQKSKSHQTPHKIKEIQRSRLWGVYGAEQKLNTSEEGQITVSFKQNWISPCLKIQNLNNCNNCRKTPPSPHLLMQVQLQVWI